MTDITKCANGCNQRLLCKRWTAPGSKYQSYAEFKPMADTGICEAYWPNAVAEAEIPDGHHIFHNED